MSKFSNKFKELRKDSGLTQGELAKAINISRSAVAMYEQGNREPDFETLEKIADYFNVRMAELVDSELDADYLTADELFLIKTYRKDSSRRLLAYAKKLSELMELEI